MALEAAFHRDDGSLDVGGTHSAWSDWIAASSTYNFCCDDPLLDWLGTYGEAKGFVPDHLRPDYDTRTDFRRFLTDRATEFEEVVTNYLATHFQLERIRREKGDTRDRLKAEETWAAMSSGVEVIAQGVLWNPESKTYGAPDLLVRSDILRRLFPSDIDEGAASHRAPDLPNLHYRVIDVKFTTLDLLRDGHAGGDHLKYMVQVWLYNEALGRMQGYTPPSSFILGRRWKDSKGRGVSALDRIARIDHDRPLKGLGTDLRAYALAACDWVRKVRREGADWTVLPAPSVAELWPNIRRTDDQPWHQAKLEIARHLEDLTLLPRITPDKRAQALAAGICRWTDPRCSAAQFSITGAKLPALVDAVIAANHSGSDGPVVFPARVTANEALWRDRVNPEFFVDFETVSDLDEDFSRFPEASGQPLIFMIGCGRFSGPAETPRWNHRVFTVRSLTLEEERRIIEEWIAFMAQACRECGSALDGSRVFHWSPAETSNLTEAYNAASVRHGEPDWPRIPWVDLLNRVVKEEPITVRGAFGFGLKAIAKAMRAHGLIETIWGDGPADGLGAMVGAWWCHRESVRTGVPMLELDLLREIQSYNEIDCKVMAETLTFLRTHR